jgi:hypothetical protein
MRLPFLANLLGNGTAGEADTAFLLEDTPVLSLQNTRFEFFFCGCPEIA